MARGGSLGCAEGGRPREPFRIAVRSVPLPARARGVAPHGGIVRLATNFAVCNRVSLSALDSADKMGDG
jgi:hypothetical protein